MWFSSQVISTPSTDASLYAQQREENEKHLCQLAARKITVATLVGGAALTLRHHRLGRRRRRHPPSAHVHVHGRIHACGVFQRGSLRSATNQNAPQNRA